jgi:hypothetical protein
MTDPDVPLNSRGTPRQRFDPLRDAPRSDSAELDEGPAFFEPDGVTDLIQAVRRQVAALGLSASPEGQSAILAAEKAVESTGSAAAACLHELRMTMNEIRSSKPAGEAQDPTEDVLGRRRERKAGA